MTRTKLIDKREVRRRHDQKQRGLTKHNGNGTSSYIPTIQAANAFSEDSGVPLPNGNGRANVSPAAEYIYMML